MKKIIAVLFVSFSLSFPFDMGYYVPHSDYIKAQISEEMAFIQYQMAEIESIKARMEVSKELYRNSESGAPLAALAEMIASRTEAIKNSWKRIKSLKDGFFDYARNAERMDKE